MYKVVLHLKDAPMIEVTRKKGPAKGKKTMAPQNTVTKVCKSPKDEADFLWMHKGNINKSRIQFLK